MKTKILLSLAALLLTAASAFAQNAAKADVNDDGIVDVADVVSVAAIKKAGAAIPITSIELTSMADAYTGSETQLTPTILPTYATDKSLAWSSSNTSVATVSQTGVIKGIAEGTTTITATTSNGKKATCEITVHQTVYYWYVGQTDPSTMTEISPIVDDISSPGWRLIGTSIPTYTFENPLYNASENPIVSNPSKNDYWFVALPVNSSLSIYNSFKGDEISSGNWIKLSNKIINNVDYNIYKIVATQRKFTGLWIH